MNEFEFAYNLISLLKAEYPETVVTGLEHNEFAESKVKTELTLADGTKLKIGLSCERPKEPEKELTKA